MYQHDTTWQFPVADPLASATKRKAQELARPFCPGREVRLRNGPVSIYGLFADPSTVASQLDSMGSVLPGGALEVLREQLTRLTEQGSASLSIGFMLGLVVSLWSANGGVKALFDALNVVYEEKEKRSFIALNAITLAFTIGTILFVSAAAKHHWRPR